MTQDDLAVRMQLAEIEAMRDVCTVDGCKVLDALALCAAQGVLPPQWLADSFVARHARVRAAEVGSWDQAFGAPYPPGTKLALLRHGFRLRQMVHAAALALVTQEPDIAMNTHFFGRVGNAEGVKKSASQTERLYRAAVKAGALDLAPLRRRTTKNPHHVAPIMRIDSLLHTPSAPLGQF